MTSATEPIRFDPYSFAVQEDPYPVYARLRREAPAYRVEPKGFWVLTRYDDCKRALQDHRQFSSSRGNLIDDHSGRTGRTLGTTDPPRHTELRRLANDAFHARRVTALEPIVRERAAALIDELVERGEGDLVTDFAAPLTSEIIIAHFLGLPMSELEQVRQWRDVIVERVEDRMGMTEEGAQAFEEAARHMHAFVAGRRAALATDERDDVITALLTAQEGGTRLSDDEIAITTLTILGAGYQSANYMLTNALLTLERHPAAFAELAADPSLIPVAQEELFRYDSPTQGFARSVREEIELHGQTLAEDDRVLVLIGSANRDEQQFERADELDIRRQPNKHISFGFGPHLCVGAPLARLIDTIALETFAARVGSWETAGPLGRVHSPTFRGLTRYPIRLERRTT
jgi:cytochrome P450